MFLIISLILLLYVLYRFYRYTFITSTIDPRNKYILITGCDTGVGHELAIQLDKNGFNVLAGVYVSENIGKLKAKLSSKATIFHLDITNEEDINTTFELVQKKTNTLYALVNNAGIISQGYIDWTSIEVMREVMNVNYFGHVMMTKKFLPLLIMKRDSRLVNLCSATGFVAIPNTSAYSASKYALEAFSDCIRREMTYWGLKVSIIEPGALRTTMNEGYATKLQDVWNQLSSDIQERWGIDFLNDLITKSVKSPFMIYADDPRKAVRAVQHAVMSVNPCLRYRPGWQAKLFFFAFYLPPTWLIDKILVTFLNFVPAGVRNQYTN